LREVEREGARREEKGFEERKNKECKKRVENQGIGGKVKP